MPQLGDLARPTLHLPAPDPKTTLEWMVRATQIGMEDTTVRLFAEKLVQGVFPHDYLSEYAAVLQWVRTHIRYTRDPTTIEQVKTARVVLETESADCDDHSILIATLLGSLGARVRFVAGAFARTDAGRPVWSHVWAEAFDPASKAWVILDPVPGRRVAQMKDRLVDAMVMMAVD